MKLETIRKIPNILTVIRAVLVPIFMFIIIFNNPNPNGESFRIFREDWMVCVVGAAIFLLISLTDMFDGKIARKYNAITDFGKFLDPIADKLLVMGGMLAIIVYYTQRTVWSRGYNTLIISMVFSLFIIIARELAVTSLRLVCKDSGGPVIAANMAGKIKTVSQVVFIIAALIEPWVFKAFFYLIDFQYTKNVQVITYASLIVMTAMTIYSGINYFVIYWPYLKKKKEDDTSKE
ncbi:MAG: CDP-diacylglycerol--glycerol-3-phosphate 3-phosphatidyltransferase [Clostridia bacterium]|nr:CDP-diacylglycerol--glycerol-3-phosphate 3-phosphatidyltransferase [Clostridia bacterium]